MFYGSQGTRGKRSVSGNAWERRLRREQRAGVGAAVETARARASIGRFGYRKRACDAGSSPSAPAKQKRSPQRAEAFSVLREKKDPRHAERVGQRLLAPPVARAGVGAAVEKIEEKRQPEDFFGHRKRGLRSNFEPFCPCHRKSPETAGLQGFQSVKKAAGRKSSIKSEKKLQDADPFFLFIKKNTVGPCVERFCPLRRAPLTVSIYAYRGALLVPAAFQTASERVKTEFLTSSKP